MGTTPRTGSIMNRRRVIILMTVAVFIVLTVIATLFFGGLPPWPVLACFAASHLTFCIIVAGVKPYRGPYRKPMDERDAKEWTDL